MAACFRSLNKDSYELQQEDSSSSLAQRSGSHKIDPGFKDKHDESHKDATPEIQKHVERLAKAQYLLYADGSKSLLVVLQALDAGGKDGVVRHVFTAMNPQGTLVASFKQPSKIEAAHDFLWRAHLHTPAKGQVVDLQSVAL